MRNHRAAFTLVEMLVAIALVLFVMVLLSQAFMAGLDTFRQLKSLGDLEERLRVVTSVLRRDLQADHFEGRKRLSELSFRQSVPQEDKNLPPREGFFRLWQSSAIFLEGFDGDNIESTRATNHILHFTVKLRGNGPQDFFSADISGDPPAYKPYTPPVAPNPGQPGGWAVVGSPDSRYQHNDFPRTGTYASQWAEVAYFLRANGDFVTSPTGQSIPLYNLYRRQLLAVPDNDEANWNPDATAPDKKAFGRPARGEGFPDSVAVYNASPVYANISCKPRPGGLMYFNSPMDLTVPQRRFGMDPAAYGGLPLPGRAGNWPPILGDPQEPQQFQILRGADLLLGDVVSFEVKVLIPESKGRAAVLPALDPFVDLFDSDAVIRGAGALPQLISVNPRFFKATDPRVFDTWSSVRDDTYDYSTWDTPDTAKSLPLRIQVLALKITLRVLDKKFGKTRQVSMIEDM